MLVVILICAETLAREACTRDTARAVIPYKPESVICGASDQWAFAQTAIKPQEDEYAKLDCRAR